MRGSEKHQKRFKDLHLEETFLFCRQKIFNGREERENFYLLIFYSSHVNKAIFKVYDSNDRMVVHSRSWIMTVIVTNIELFG